MKKKETNLLVLGAILLGVLAMVLILISGNGEATPPEQGTTPTGTTAPVVTEPTEHVHTWDKQVTEAACATGGYTTFRCACGESYMDEKTEPRGHSWIEATCTAPKTCAACGIQDGRENGHSWDAGKVQKEATENDDGELLLTCSACGQTKLQAIPSLNHVHAYDEETVVAPTCTEGGYTIHTCRCGDSRTDGETAALGHNWQGASCQTPKTCVVCGSTEGGALGHTWQPATCTSPKTCSACGIMEGRALGHSWQAATCTAPKTCTACGTAEGSALGHSWQAATCTAPKTCSTCGAVEGREKGHSWDNGKVKAEAQEGKDGLLLLTCKDCGQTKEQIIPALNHTHNYDTAVVTPPTCTEGGYTTHTCRCGDSFTDSNVPAAGHGWKAATCLEPKTCNVCGATEGSAAGHRWEAATCHAPKTCSACGLTEGTALTHVWIGDGCTSSKICERCGDPEGIIYGHQPVKVPEVKPTCTEEGRTEGENCGVCGSYLSGQEVAASLGHLQETVPGFAAGCTTTGMTDGAKCGRCGILLQEQTQIPVTGHSYGSWSVTKQPTCVDTGVESSTCSGCGDTKTQTVAATGVHDYVKCVCSHCGATQGSKKLTFRLHSSGEYYICTGMDTYSRQSEIVIPSYYNGLPVKEIGTGPAFPDTYKLTIMEGIEKIGEHAFYYSASLKTVYLPNSLRYIGLAAFNYCDNLERVYLNTTGWKAISKYTGSEKTIDFSTELMIAETLRKEATAYFTRG